MCREFFAGYPEGMSAKTTAMAAPGRDVLIRVYRLAGKAPEAMALYFPGGSFTLCGLKSHDDAYGAALATNHLISLGHKCIAMIGGTDQTSTGRDRYQGYLNAMDAVGLEIL